MRRVVFGVLLLAQVACGDTKTAAQGSAQAAPPNPDQVIAEVGGRKITLKELDEKWQSLDPGERARITQLLYQNRRNVLDQFMGDLLIEDAAKAAGLSVVQYLEQERKKREQPIAEAEILQFFEANKDRAQGRTIEQLRGPITEYLQSQREQQTRAQIVDDLKNKRAGEVKVLLDPPRVEVALEPHDPAQGPVFAPITIVEFSDYQ